MDRSWMYELRRDSAEYLARVDEFIKCAERYRVKTKDNDILCPCRDCSNFKRFGDLEEIRAHLICRGFQKRYTCWFMHGEKIGECSATNRNFVLEDNIDINVEVIDNLELHSNDDFENVENFDNVLEFDCNEGVCEIIDENAKKLICPMGLKVEKIHACPNDCVLYHGEYEAMHVCPKCGVSRYRRKNQDTDDGNDEGNKGRAPAKSVWYFSIIPRFKRLFANPKYAKLLCWHEEERKRDGPRQPENDIDVYLAPLIEDLQQLWRDGVRVWDAYGKEQFELRAMVFCTINDFPVYGNLSSYSTKGEKACPICEDDTQVLRLKNCKKNIFMGHRRFLPINHPYRKKKKKEFNGNTELGVARRPLDGKGVFLLVKNLKVVFEKCAKAPPKNIWKKNLIGTLLNIPGNTKDDINARKDMVEMKIRPKLAPQDKGKQKAYLPPAMCTMSKTEKTSFYKCLHSIKVPSGYSSNIKKLVSMKDMELIGPKPHDCHVLMTHMILVAIRGILPKPVRQAITKLCFFFNAINSKLIDPLKLDALQKEVVVTLCHLEMYFSPSFFDVMVHLVMEIKICGPVFLRYMYPFERFMGILKSYVRNRHRPEGSIVEGYSTEEVIEFCTNYMTGVGPIGIPKSRYEGRLQGVGTIGLKPIVAGRDELLKAHFIVLQHMADVTPYIDEHMAILRQQNYTRSQKWITDEHNRCFVGWLKERVKSHSEMSPVSETVRLLGQGPQMVVRTFQGYKINGYTFYTKLQSDKSTMQNSGVTLVATSQEFSRSGDAQSIMASKSYYGVIEEIWELFYNAHLSIPLFRCQWVEDRGVKVDNDGFTLVDFNKVGYVDDPFILAKQATQVFYVTDPSDARWSIVLPGKRRIVGIENVIDEEEYDQFDEIPPFCADVQAEIATTTEEQDEANYMRSDHSEETTLQTQYICDQIKRNTLLIYKMAANNEEPVAEANKKEPAPVYGCFPKSWPWPPLSKPRRSPRGHPDPKPYIRRAKRQQALVPF
ncbi:uncharacterized protein LOC144561985 [Carex rostrata]